MALIEKSFIDKIEVLQNNVIQIRIANVIEKNEIEISKTYHRHIIVPGQDISNEDIKVQTIASAIWTNDVINAYSEYKAKISALENK